MRDSPVRNDPMKHLVLESLYRLRADRFMRLLSRNKVSILAYHGFTDCATHPGIENSQGKHLHVDQFRLHLDYLRRHYHVIALDELVEAYAAGARLPARTLAITIDDGYRSNYTLAYPLLREYGLPATIFLTTAFLDAVDLQWSDRVEYALSRTTVPRLELPVGGETLACDLDDVDAKLVCDRRLRTRLKTVPQESRAAVVEDLERRLGQRLQDAAEIPAIYRPLSWADVREMQQSGLVSLGSHTVSHLVLTRCEATRAQRELADSRRRIEAETGVPCQLFCYPNGKAGCFDVSTKAMLRAAGYACGVTTVFGRNGRFSDVFELKRLYTDRPGMARFVMTVSGVVGVLDALKRATPLPGKRPE
jgi:peptidoglycan/xylan/chitin deacetylase (PgdA/CDA1 family)